WFSLSREPRHRDTESTEVAQRKLDGGGCLRTGFLSSFNNMVVALDIVSLVNSDVLTLNAAPFIASQKCRLPLRCITMQRLSHTAVLARDYEIPSVGLADR